MEPKKNKKKREKDNLTGCHLMLHTHQADPPNQEPWLVPVTVIHTPKQPQKFN